MASIELDEKSKKILEFLRKANKPLTLDEVVAGVNMERKEVVKIMLPLTKQGIIKTFIREEQGETKAVYVVL